MWRTAVLVIALSPSVACGGAVAGESSAPDAGTPLDASADAHDAPAEAEASPLSPDDPVLCAGGGVLTYEKSCTTTADCVVVTVYVGCCHSDALGCNASDAARLADAAVACEQGDPCDCAGDVVVADDGRTSTAPHQSDVVVTCSAGECRSSVP